jgi:hypothetical protein
MTYRKGKPDKAANNRAVEQIRDKESAFNNKAAAYRNVVTGRSVHKDGCVKTSYRDTDGRSQTIIKHSNGRIVSETQESHDADPQAPRG